MDLPEKVNDYKANDKDSIPSEAGASFLAVPNVVEPPRPVPPTVAYTTADDIPFAKEKTPGAFAAEIGTITPSRPGQLVSNPKPQPGDGNGRRELGSAEGPRKGGKAGYEKRGGFKTKQEKGRKKRDLGRVAYSKKLEQRPWSRNTEDWREPKRVKVGGADSESLENPAALEGEKEQRRPKRKVAVLVGYCGHGYKGMQLNPPRKTIEGDLFEAFVKAGAISRANSNDPKKSSLVRCARTDKGVHAAGNVISLKLIIEDSDIIDKINSHLPKQIRVWDIIRTLGSFNCYQLCDSRIYEYLIPTHVFLPPHPNTFLGRTLRKQAIAENDLDGWVSRQEEVANFWDEVQKEINPLVEEYGKEMLEAATEHVVTESEREEPLYKKEKRQFDDGDVQIGAGGNAMSLDLEPTSAQTVLKTSSGKIISDELLKKIKHIHIEQKRSWRVPPKRLERVHEILKLYEGTNNFYNYTIRKAYNDASAKRHIKSFTASEPILINGTEYLSLKVHGQSFMMHQIRKMVGMMLLVVRTGCSLSRITDSYGGTPLPIPKAPGVGLLLCEPVFSTYNKKVSTNTNPAVPEREVISFERHKDNIDDFKDKFIYQRMFYEEEKGNLFHSFVSFIDGFKNAAFTYLGSKGLKAVEEAKKEGKWLMGTSGKMNEIEINAAEYGGQDVDSDDCDDDDIETDDEGGVPLNDG